MDHATTHLTPSGIRIDARREAVDRDAATHAIDAIARALDERRGGVLTSGFEHPGRYSRWDVGFVDPPLVVESRGDRIELRALNARGLLLLPPLSTVLEGEPAFASSTRYCDRFVGRLRPRDRSVAEESKLRQPSALSVVRALITALGIDGREPLGFYGAFGYDLVFALEDLEARMPRDPAQRDLVLYLADDLVVVDHEKDVAHRHVYDFACGVATTHGLPREPLEVERVASPSRAPREPDESRFRAGVERAKEAFAAGHLFEVVLSQTFERTTAEAPSTIFARLRRSNPAPYGFYLSLGAGERLVGASPEMFVRVEARRVETCPIAGTIARHGDPLIDAERIRALLTSEKEEAELTMCTDVDRNDKARVTEPGSVRVIGRREIEVYSRVIHTVDHVEGTLRADCDAIDAMLAHAWAVTVTGAPKVDAMQFIEDHEDEPRRFYSGAVGFLGVDGRANTGLAIRAIHFEGSLARVRAGATLLHASDPVAEELESRAKAAAVLDALDPAPAVRAGAARTAASFRDRTILLIDHRDSFVHTLGDYLRRTGARVVTYRAGFDESVLDDLRPDLAVLSPGPGSPSEFQLSRSIEILLARNVPIFGVCLGLQGIVEHFGGALARLETPAHGRASTVHATPGALFAGLPTSFRAGRYHSLYAEDASIPGCLEVTARSEDGVVMAVEHRSLPIFAVQFHPESILTPVDVGLGILGNVLARADYFAEKRSSTTGIATSS